MYPFQLDMLAIFWAIFNPIELPPSPFLATDAFVAASAILSQATLVDPTMSEEDEARSHSGRPSSIKIKGFAQEWK